MWLFSSHTDSKSTQDSAPMSGTNVANTHCSINKIN